MRLNKKVNPSNSFPQNHLMEIYWHIPRIKQVKSSRTRANPEASNMMAPLLVSVPSQCPRWSRRLLGATRRGVSAKHASLLRHKMTTDRCHFVWRQKVRGRGLNTNQRTKRHTGSNGNASESFSPFELLKAHHKAAEWSRTIILAAVRRRRNWRWHNRSALSPNDPTMPSGTQQELGQIMMYCVWRQRLGGDEFWLVSHTRIMYKYDLYNWLKEVWRLIWPAPFFNI